MNNKQIKILALFLSLELVGCTITVKQYEGRDLERDQIAIITMDGPLRASTVDGERVKRASKGIEMIGGPHKLLILPGKHTIELFFSSGYIHSVSNRSVTLTAEAGNSYHIKANIIGNTWNPSIVELTDQ